MIFKPDMIELIKARRKSQTRRPVDVITESPLKVIPCRYKVGHVYKAQPGRGQKGVFELTVTEVRMERLGEITQADARREGFRFRAQFEAKWRELYGSWDESLWVWVVGFAVGDLRDKFDRLRLLASTPGHVRYEKGEPAKEGGLGRWRVSDDGDEQDYTDRTDRCAHAAGEGVDAKTLERFSAEGYAGHCVRYAQEIRRRHVRSLAIRLKDAERRGDAEAIVRISGELQALAQRMRTAA